MPTMTSPTRPGAVLDAPDPAQQEAEWQVAVKQATQAAQMMGQLPGGMAQAVEQATKPRIDWKALLRRFVQQFASADYSWRMPNRRYIAGGIYLPELRSESMPAIVVAVDTSASTSSVLPNFKAELQSIVDECQPEATIVIMADAAVQRVDRFERGDPIEFNVEGLGGTDFRPVFEHVDREQFNPACLIYLTDGDGCYPDEPSDYPTLWAITTPTDKRLGARPSTSTRRRHNFMSTRGGGNAPLEETQESQGKGFWRVDLFRPLNRTQSLAVANPT